jgi:hypothetical protein
MGSAIGAGFTLLGRRFFSVIAWGFFLYFALIVLFGIGFAIVGFSVIGDLGKLATPGAGTDPTVARDAVLHVLIAMWPALLVVVIGMVLVGAMIQGAVFRSILFPDDRGFFSLRLGGREMALVLLNILIVLCVMVVYLVSAIILIVVFSAASAIHSDGPWGGVLAVLFCIVYALGLMWFLLRFSMAAPMTFAEGRVRLFSSWTLTKGHGWTLFGLAWLLVLVFIGVSIGYSIINGIVTSVFVMGSVASMGSIGNSNDPSAVMSHLPALLLGFIPSLILGAAFQGVSQAILQGPWAEVYRELRGTPDVSTTFS